MVIVVVVMGVAGSGKTTVGSALAAARGWRFVHADDVHAPASVAKMARGEALTDADRAPWLARLRAIIVDALAQNTPLVLACSALEGRLPRGAGGRRRRARGVVHLAATPALLRQRLEARPGHYMKATMLDGQLATLRRRVIYFRTRGRVPNLPKPPRRQTCAGSPDALGRGKLVLPRRGADPRRVASGRHAGRRDRGGAGAQRVRIRRIS